MKGLKSVNILWGVFLAFIKKKKLEERRKEQNNCLAKSLGITTCALELFVLGVLLWEPQSELRWPLKSQISVGDSAVFELSRSWNPVFMWQWFSWLKLMICWMRTVTCGFKGLFTVRSKGNEREVRFVPLLLWPAHLCYYLFIYWSFYK